MTCEKCWADAYLLKRSFPMKSQAECYREILKNRKNHPCTPQQQAGQFWNAETQQDSRIIVKRKA